MTWKINPHIPGWNGLPILNIIAEHAAAVPENGLIVELGALFGRSTYSLGWNKKESVKLVTIDIWTDIHLKNHPRGIYDPNTCGERESVILNSRIKQPENMLSSLDYVNMWALWTKDIPNLCPRKGRTSQPNVDLPNIDFIYHDANHTYEGVRDDLIHWWPNLKPGGVFIIDDYEHQFEGLMRAVNEFMMANNLGPHAEVLPTNRNLLIRKPL
jgi:hypothetical protein